MSLSKIMKMDRDAAISPNMMLLHLRWQQIRLELLQQAVAQTSQPEGSNHQDNQREEAFA